MLRIIITFCALICIFEINAHYSDGKQVIKENDLKIKDLQDKFNKLKTQVENESLKEFTSYTNIVLEYALLQFVMYDTSDPINYISCYSLIFNEIKNSLRTSSNWYHLKLSENQLLINDKKRRYLLNQSYRKLENVEQSLNNMIKYKDCYTKAKFLKVANEVNSYMEVIDSTNIKPVVNINVLSTNIQKQLLSMQLPAKLFADLNVIISKLKNQQHIQNCLRNYHL